MTNLETIGKLEQQLGRAFVQVDPEEFWAQQNQHLLRQNAYGLSDQGEVTLLSLGGLDEADILTLPWSQLSAVSCLNLFQVEVAQFEFLRALSQLTHLRLRESYFSHFSQIKTLEKLQVLDLCFNRITDFSFLSDLKSLTTLDLRNNSITDFSFLSDLKSLTTLDLRNNSITDCSFLSDLKSLTTLDLSSNSITDCSFLSDLKSLTTLDLRNNSITDFSFLSDLKSLTTLDLRDNSITDCSFLSDLKSLTTLDLSYNSITDCSFLSDLKSLTTLDLRNNKVSELSEQILQLGLKILNQVYPLKYNSINIYGNPIHTPPLEVINQGNEAIQSYFAQLKQQGKDYLYEAKLLIVGEGEAGKTTLAAKINNPNCPLPHIDDRTKGITIHPHHFTVTDTRQNASRLFQLNIWDFGGQEIYHYTHRFFLTKRSLYALVADNRSDNTDFNYWLNIIELFAADSPMLIVLNEKGDIQRTLNRSELNRRFAHSVKGTLAVNFQTHEEPDRQKQIQRLKGINDLINKIECEAKALEHIGEPVPARWIDVRAAIEADSRTHIYRQQFDQLCQDHDIQDLEDISVLLSYFHDLGTILHFADNPLLRQHVILKPEWATQAVYRIFDHDTIKAKQGRFTRQDCLALWSEQHYEHMQDVLIEIMKNFQLLYEIETSGQLVAPQMLPDNSPEYPWNSHNNSVMHFRYDLFMPKGILWKFIIEMYRYIRNHDWVWKNGVILEREGAQAEIIENLFERRIYIRLTGTRIYEFRAIITDQLDRISQTFHTLAYDKMIPCNCSQCQPSSDPHFFKYNKFSRSQID